jgi:anti-sigma factor RsiW
MKITRNVIEDLLPLYLADEVSADTRTLVEEYLETDPELANMAQDLAKMELPGDIPVPLTKEDQMEAYKEAKRLMFLRTVVLVTTIAITLSCAFGGVLLAIVWFGVYRLVS